MKEDRLVGAFENPIHRVHLKPLEPVESIDFNNHTNQGLIAIQSIDFGFAEEWVAPSSFGNCSINYGSAERRSPSWDVRFLTYLRTAPRAAMGGGGAGTASGSTGTTFFGRAFR
jgi:hypothetical protein